MLLFFQLIQGCENRQPEIETADNNSAPADSNEISVQFSFEINKELYQKTNYGQPPQIAIWIESVDSTDGKTVWVTHRTAKQDWEGKIECPVSLPFWESRIVGSQENPGLGSKYKSEIDAVTHATPTDGTIETNITVPKNSIWTYYIEVNVSADYNETFSYWSKEGLPDSEGNGQPSIIFSGQISADGKSDSIPVLVGRTDQRHTVKNYSRDLNGISSAKYLINKLQVKSWNTTDTESEGHQ